MIGESGINHHLMSGDHGIQTVHFYPNADAEPSEEPSEQPCEG